MLMFKLMGQFVGNGDNICEKIDLATEVAENQANKNVEAGEELKADFDPEYRQPYALQSATNVQIQTPWLQEHKHQSFDLDAFTEAFGIKEESPFEDEAGKPVYYEDIAQKQT